MVSDVWSAINDVSYLPQMIIVWYNNPMRFHLTSHPLVLQLVGGIVGMCVALLLYLALQQYSLSTLRGALVGVASSSEAATDATASIQAAGAERTEARDALIRERLAALANRHPSPESSSADSSVSPSSTPTDAPSVAGNPIAPVDTKERLTQRAARFPVIDRIGGSEPVITAASSSGAPRELAGVPLTSETITTQTSALPVQESTPVPTERPVRRPLPKSGPADDIILLLAFAGAGMLMLRKRQAAESL